ncbi:hypothetical protein J1765_gp57 [Gordonia phage Gaea]|uniref:Uncharacterized protein n=1 Tax=Gordonia phage Gaea TaxID=2483669 RepID=A0A3G3M8Y1_9CAUD|nr:hypothetical protein J1765_gp57 [Gordonia phage Gaea]AYR02865.1 hypothetical protein SEA_GAEA_57 [Gordonia phage Gaea]
MTDHRTPRRTPRTDADELINRARTTDHLVDIPGIGAVATAAAILDLADAIREGIATDDEPDNTPTPPEQLLCLAEGRTPRGNRVVCGEQPGHNGPHSAGGFWWSDGGSGFAFPPGYVAKMPDVVGGWHAVARDVPDGSHIAGSAPAPEPVSSPVQPPNGDADPLWRLRLLAGRARRAAGRAPLVPREYELGALVDDLDETVQQLIKSRDNWADAASAPTPDVCGYPGANGTCRREPGHSGLHHDEYGGVYVDDLRVARQAEQ